MLGEKSCGGERRMRRRGGVGVEGVGGGEYMMGGGVGGVGGRKGMVGEEEAKALFLAVRDHTNPFNKIHTRFYTPI